MLRSHVSNDLEQVTSLLQLSHLSKEVSQVIIKGSCSWKNMSQYKEEADIKKQITSMQCDVYSNKTGVGGAGNQTLPLPGSRGKNVFKGKKSPLAKVLRSKKGVEQNDRMTEVGEACQAKENLGKDLEA